MTTPVSVINTVTLPIFNKTFTSVNVASIPVLKNSFLDLSLDVEIGPNSNINIIIPGLSPLVLKDVVNKNLKLNNFPFNNSQTITIIFNVYQNETINVKQLNYKISENINYKCILIIFLIVYFIIFFKFK